jgi:hypothetical protein
MSEVRRASFSLCGQLDLVMKLDCLKIPSGE